MGYPVQANAPQFKVGVETYALGAFKWDGGMAGNYFIFGIYRLDSNQGWVPFQEYRIGGDPANPATIWVLDDLKAKGGRVAYSAWIKQLFNNWFKALFHATPPVDPTAEPTTEEEAEQMMIAWVNAFTVTITNGVPSV